MAPVGVIAAKKAGIKCVVTPHGFENAMDLKLKLFIWLGCKAMKYADMVAPLSKQIVEDVKGFGIDDSQICYIQNAGSLFRWGEGWCLGRLGPDCGPTRGP